MVSIFPAACCDLLGKLFSVLLLDLRIPVRVVAALSLMLLLHLLLPELFLLNLLSEPCLHQVLQLDHLRVLLDIVV